MYLEYGGDRDYYLATAADKVFLMPSSPLDVAGVATYEVFLRGTLDKVGVQCPTFAQIGDYKTAANQFTETGFTPAHREMTEALNRSLLRADRRGDRRGAEALRSGGPGAGRRGTVSGAARAWTPSSSTVWRTKTRRFRRLRDATGDEGDREISAERYAQSAACARWG